MMAILGEMAAGQEVYSIDESFLDIAGISNLTALDVFGHLMRRRVLQKLLPQPDTEMNPNTQIQPHG